MEYFVLAVPALLSAFQGLVHAQSVCPTPVTGSVPTPLTAAGYDSRLVATGLKYPRGIVFDTAGHLLVADRGAGIKALTLQDNGGSCLSVTETKLVISNANLNHGIDFMDNGATLLASTADALLAYTYDADTATVNGTPRTLVKGMNNPDHSTRTILHSSKKPGAIILNRGSEANIDPKASNKSSGHAQVKSFDVTQTGKLPFDFITRGKLLGWGMRNNVGIAEHPVTGGIWTVENSVDNIQRNGVQFSANNPGEKLQYLGTLLNNQSPNQGSNFGYPECFAAWAPSKVPNHGNLKVGQQFSIAPDIISDKGCQTQRTAPRFIFDAHMAPLDIKFGPQAGAAYVSFHGSFNRPVPQGYKVSRIPFGENGEPVASAVNSKTGIQDIVFNQNKGSCPDNCFRPVGLAIDKKARLFFSSDRTGEIYVATFTG